MNIALCEYTLISLSASKYSTQRCTSHMYIYTYIVIDMPTYPTTYRTHLPTCLGMSVCIYIYVRTCIQSCCRLLSWCFPLNADWTAQSAFLAAARAFQLAPDWRQTHRWHSCCPCCCNRTRANFQQLDGRASGVTPRTGLRLLSFGPYCWVAT